METESVRSETSGRSRRSRHRSNRSCKSRRDCGDGGMSPLQTSVQVNSDRQGHDVVQVQILPQDDNWGENTTALTGDTSEGSPSAEDLADWPLDADSGIGVTCRRRVGPVLVMGLACLAWLSPLAMLALPQLGFSAGVNLQPSQRAQLLTCAADCKGKLVALACKLALLAAGAWAAPLMQRAFLPRVCTFRAASVVALAVCVFAYWLFYAVQVAEAERAISLSEEAIDYNTLVTYASSFVDVLIFLHYVVVLLTEVRQLEPKYYIKIVRSPDGESRSYCIGQLSIQRAAVWALHKYYTEFSIYNPYLEKIPMCKSERKARSSIKLYEVDGSDTGTAPGHNRSRATSAVDDSSSRRRSGSAHNERYYEEAERERRVRKRRARLVTASEEAFAHVRRVRVNANNGALTPREAAQAVFPSLARALQKYLRATRQQPQHTADSVLEHLARCLSQDVSPRAFLEPYLVAGPVLAQAEARARQRWALVSPQPPAGALAAGLLFQLRQGDVSLSCSIISLPEIRLSEELVDPKSNRFVLRLNSETSV